MSKEALPVYDNRYWKGKTPNIDELARNGTVYHRHYASGGSTAMSLSGMLAGHYPHEFTSRKTYDIVQESEFPSMFNYFQQNGYECNLIWDTKWTSIIWPRVREFGDESRVHLFDPAIAAYTGSGKANENDVLIADDAVLQQTKQTIFDIINGIDLSKKQFIWMHLPHVLKGRACYMADMDAFDEIVGFVRNKVGDDSIILTTDHGHLNMHKGKVGYGFHVYEPIAIIPLITPCFNGVHDIDYLTSNIDIAYACCRRQPLPKREYVFCDTQYYWQPKRVLGIITEQYKYIFNKFDKSEEPYDLKNDPDERYNILVNDFYDEDRKKHLTYDEYVFYPNREQALRVCDELRTIKNGMYMEQSKKSKIYEAVAKRLPFIRKVRAKLKK